MQYCSICILPDTRPQIQINKKNVCSACEYAKKKSKDLILQKLLMI